jgi:hypothetical protein
MDTITTPEIGAWDEVTAGFWTGGRHVTAGELLAGDIYRWHTYVGYVVTRAESHPAWVASDGREVWPAYVDVVTPTGSHTYSPGEPLELVIRRADVVGELERDGRVRVTVNGATVDAARFPYGQYDALVSRGGCHVSTGGHHTAAACVARACELALATDETGAENLYGTYRGPSLRRN